jgi:predicted PurR-regulated permease PerM
VAVLFLVVVELIEQGLYYVVIRPKFIDARTHMYPLAIFLAIVSGITSFGPMGLVYGPLIMAALLALMEQQLRQPASLETVQESSPLSSSAVEQNEI